MLCVLLICCIYAFDQVQLWDMHNRWVHSRYGYTKVILNFLISHSSSNKKQLMLLSLDSATSYHSHCLSQHLQVSLQVICSSIIAASNSFYALQLALVMQNITWPISHPCLTKHLQWFPTAFSVKIRILTERLTWPEYSDFSYLSRHSNKTLLSATLTCSHSSSFPVSFHSGLCRMLLPVPRRRTPNNAKFPTPTQVSPIHPLKLKTSLSQGNLPCQLRPSLRLICLRVWTLEPVW